MPFSVRMSFTHFPVASRTLGTAYWSLRTRPILAIDMPSPANFATRSLISSADCCTHFGFSVTRGFLDPDEPFLLECILDIAYLTPSVLCQWRGRAAYM